jgi:TonB-linked SusC/RagA family outer membrane protein
MNKYMKSKITVMFLILALMLSLTSISQNARSGIIVQGQITSGKDNEKLIGVSVAEFDVNNRVVSGTLTDVNGQYVLRVKSTGNKLQVSYIGFLKQLKNINNSKTINFVLVENTKVMNEIVVKGAKTNAQGGYSIPTREIGTAIQTINAKEFEGLQVSSVGDVLQGRIAGLDIVSNSSDPGSGTSMRIRGITSITGSSEPLIVVNGVPYEVQIDPNFDYANSNQEQYANMLSINPDDISEISVLKDAASSAIWGSKGANGVIMITTKRGTKGPVKVEYTYRYTRTVQPKGISMLNGDNFTMLMKEAYLNPSQDDRVTNIPEYNYDPNFPNYENFNNNTDWVKAVTQVGNISDHYLTVSGGGDRATYRLSAGYNTQNGTVIGSKYSRVSSRANLDYTVSDRIKFSSEISMTSSDNPQNYMYNFNDGNVNQGLSILAIAYQKMPNVSIYAQDRQGNNTGIYFNIPTSSGLNVNQRNLVNPVALANLATNDAKSFRITPTFRLQYDLIDPEVQMLRFSSYVSFDISNEKNVSFLPQDVSNVPWTDPTSNRSSNFDSENLTIYSDENINWQPKFTNKDQSLILYGSFQINFGNSSGQGMDRSSMPSAYAPESDGYLVGSSTSTSQWRSLAFMIRTHYAYKSRYIIDATLRREGSTKFGNGSKFGNFPGLSLRYNISDEPFMKKTNKWLSMLSFRPSWGISGNQPGAEYLYLSRYNNYGSYLDMSAWKPSSLQLTNLKWETSTQFNYGMDIALFDYKYVFDLNYYTKQTKDMLFQNPSLPSTSGFGSYSYINGGIMNNTGWEVNFSANRFIKTKDFSVDFAFNFSNGANELVNLNQSLLDSKNGDFNYQNGNYLTRIQTGNSFGAIYGFKYEGVYRYDKYTSAHTDAPVAKDANGNVINDEDGKPKPMWYNYSRLNGGQAYQFRGGDAKYADINHDGVIDALDIVYLGNCNPKLNGGFGPTFHYRDFSCKLFFNFRYGNKVIDMARMNAENMYTDNNQSIAVNWRWRKDGDITQMPRALYQTGYNWLGSDRYVEDGSFLRFKYLTFNYSVPPKFLKSYSLNRLNLYLTFDNLFVLTHYSGLDPEVGYGNLNENNGQAVDANSTPRTRDFTLGITVGL